MDRPLGGLERQFWQLGAVASANAVAVVRVRGGLEPDGLRAALSWARRRHPLLGVHVVEAAAGPRFEAESTPPLPLRLAPEVPPEAWPAEAEAEMAEAFPSRGPLARAALLGDGDATTLLVTFHHALADGTSAFDLALDLLRVAGGTRVAAEPLPAPPLGELLGAPRGGGLATLREGLGAVATALAPGKPRFPPEAAAPPPERRTGILHRRLDADVTAALVERSRAEGTTVHGALAAAWLGALRDEAGQDGTYTLNSAVNVRPYLPRAPPARSFGLYAAARNTFHRVARDRPFWDLAREARASLAAAVQGPALAAYLARLERRVPGPTDPSRTARMVDAMDRWFPPRVALTNLGRLEAPDLGRLAMEDITFTPSMAAGGCAVLVVAATTQGRLSMTTVHPMPLVGRARAARLAEGAAARLAEAARG